MSLMCRCEGQKVQGEHKDGGEAVWRPPVGFQRGQLKVYRYLLTNIILERHRNVDIYLSFFSVQDISEIG